jgi:bifunctional non-homologous end joining protein LigD
MPGNLATYKRKRDFSRTPEPGPRKAKPAKRPRFVVQKHDASRLHYDLRLEVDGVMKSWAVPKGPSPNPAYKRLAVMTEDHPIAYNRFEGVIPEGEYGAGSVIVWDRGWYENASDVSPAKAIRAGAFSFELHGKKLRGRFTLRHMDGKNWLLIKGKDEYADRSIDLTAERPESVVSGRTVEQVARAG